MESCLLTTCLFYIITFQCWTWKQLIDIGNLHISGKIRINYRKSSSGNFRKFSSGNLRTRNPSFIWPVGEVVLMMFVWRTRRRLVLQHWRMRRFGGRQKSPQEVIRTLKEGLLVLNRYDNKDDKRRQKVWRAECIGRRDVEPCHS